MDRAHFARIWSKRQQSSAAAALGAFIRVQQFRRCDQEVLRRTSMVSAIHSRMCSLIILVAGLVATPHLASTQEAASMNMDHDHLHHHHAIFDKVPEKSRTKSNPLADDPDAPIAGRKLFEQHCAACHGANAEGIRHKAPNLHKDEVQNASPGSIFWIL